MTHLAFPQIRTGRAMVGTSWSPTASVTRPTGQATRVTRPRPGL